MKFLAIIFRLLSYSNKKYYKHYLSFQALNHRPLSRNNRTFNPVSNALLSRKNS